jgi:ADP-ribose pyrophosphatase
MEKKLADRPADVTVSPPESLAKGYRPYERYHVTLRDADGTSHGQERDIVRGGKVAAVLPIDLARDEIVLIRQFRLAAHIATGNGDMVEIVAGRVETGEQPIESARRECTEEIGVAPGKVIELFQYLTTPGVTDEEVIVFLASVDAARVPTRPVNPDSGERIETLRVPIDTAIAALAGSAMRNGPMVMALQWLALNRARLPELLAV